MERLLERREAKEAALGRWVRVLGGASPARRPCLLLCGVRDRRPLSQVEEWVLTGLRRQSEQMCPQRRPRRLVGEVGTTWSARPSSISTSLGSDELLGRDMEPVGVALDGVEQPGRRVAEFSQQGGG